MANQQQELTTRLANLEKQLERKQIEMHSIQQIGKALSRELRTRRLLPLIMNEVTRLMNAERSTFYIVDRERGELWSQIAQKAEIKEIRLKVGTGIAGYVAKTGEVINIEDAYRDDRFDPSTDKKTGYHTRSILCMPIFEPLSEHKKSPDIIGVLQVLNKKDGVFTEDDEELLASMASQIAISIINARLYSSLEKRVSELNLMFEIEQELNKVYDLDELLRFLLEKITSTLQTQAAALVLLKENGQEFKKLRSLHIGPERLQALHPSPHTGRLGDVIRKGQIFFTNQAGKEKWLKDSFRKKEAPDFELHHFVCAPLIVNDKVIGVLELFNKTQPNEIFRQEDLRLLGSLTSQIARSIEAHRLREEKIKADRLASIGNMMSAIVHDLRTPINNIFGFVDLMREEEDSQLRNEYGDIVKEQIDILTNMTKDVLDFAKGKTNILPIKYPVDKLITNFTRLFENNIRNQGYEFESSCEAAGSVYVDPEKLNRVFMNIMKNALEAMEPGGKFSIGAEEQNGEIVFHLADTGSGIPEEIRDRLFDSFVTSGKEGGTGLGLAIVKKLVEQHKGRIEVESELGKGTTFNIYFKKL